jgi:hypothetical protein
MFMALILRYKLGLEIILFGILAAGALYGVHEFLEHERDIGRKEIQQKWDKQTANDLKAKEAQEALFKSQLEQAAINGANREQTIRTLSAAAGSANVGLRDTLTAIRNGVPTATIDALGKSVATLSTLFTECSGRYQDVATKADRHASDVKTLQEAWPKNPPKAIP